MLVYVQLCAPSGHMSRLKSSVLHVIARIVTFRKAAPAHLVISVSCASGSDTTGPVSTLALLATLQMLLGNASYVARNAKLT